MAPYHSHLLTLSGRSHLAAYRKMTIKGVAGLALSPATSGPSLSKLCAFIPEAKGSPASAGVYDWTAPPTSTGGGGGGEAQALVRKSFFRTSGAQLLWQPKGGNAVLVLAFTDFDVTNQSYYGEQR